MQFGSLAGLFYGVQMLSSVANGEKSIGDTVLAATAAGGVFGGFRKSTTSLAMLNSSKSPSWTVGPYLLSLRIMHLLSRHRVALVEGICALDVAYASKEKRFDSYKI